MNDKAVTVEMTEELLGLYSAYLAAKQTVDTATERLDIVKTTLKAELHRAAPDASTVSLMGPGNTGQATLRAVTAYRLDTARLKEEQPEVYVRYATASTRWELRTTP